MRCYIGKRPVMVVVIEVPCRGLVFGESLYVGTVGKENVRPSVVVVIENDGAVTSGLDDEFFVSVAAVYVERAQSRLPANVLEVNFARFDFRHRRLCGLRCLGCKPACEQCKHCEKQNGSEPLDSCELAHPDILKQESQLFSTVSSRRMGARPGGGYWVPTKHRTRPL